MKKPSSHALSEVVAPLNPEGPVMLTLSTFRRSERAVELALEKAMAVGEVVLVNVVDVNLARYFVGIDIGLYPEVKEQAEAELLEAHRKQGCEGMMAIAARSEAKGLKASIHVRTGRFALECLKLVEEVKPSLIVTCRSRRPAWVKKLFGSPVDYLIAHTSCPVIEAERGAVSRA